MSQFLIGKIAEMSPIISFIIGILSQFLIGKIAAKKESIKTNTDMSQFLIGKIAVALSASAAPPRSSQFLIGKIAGIWRFVELSITKVSIPYR